MRVVLLSTNMARGGAETQVARLAILLRERGWEASVISLLPPSAFEADLKAAGVPLYAPGLARIPALLRRLRPHVLHCHMFHANLAGRLLRVVMPFPVVISTLHSVAESSRRSEKIRLRDWCYRATDALADATVAVSQAVAERHRKARAVSHARVIPNGVDTSRFRADADVRARMRRELAVEGEFVWIAVGRLMWKKNYPALLAAFGQLGRGTLLIAGSGPQELELRKAAPPGVRFLGEREDIADLLNAADAFVLASVVEGLPVALLEAAATGLPCVATDAGGVRETGIGLVCRPDALAACMRGVAEMDTEERAHLGKDGRRQVLARYSLDVVVSRWEELYRTLTALT